MDTELFWRYLTYAYSSGIYGTHQMDNIQKVRQFAGRPSLPIRVKVRSNG